MLGEGCKQAIYYFIAKDSGVKREEIPEKPQEFIDALKKIFGPGAAILEKSLVKEIEADLGITLQGENFAEAVEEARRWKTPRPQ